MRQPISALVLGALVMIGSAGLGICSQDTPAAADEEGESTGQVDKPEERVVVSASRMETALMDTPAAVTIIDQEEIGDSAAGDFGDLLRRAPGVNVIQFGARDVHINTRGPVEHLAHSQQVLLDSRSVYQDFFGFVHWDALPVSLDEIERIEVVRGPASAAWGANALTGVVNIITRTPWDMAGTRQLQLSAGEVGTRSAAVLAADAMSDTWAWKVSGSWYEQDSYERPDHPLPNGRLLPDYDDPGTRQPRLDLRFDRKGEGGNASIVEIGAAGTSGIILAGHGPVDIDPLAIFTYSRYREKRGNTEWQIFLNTTDGESESLLADFPMSFDVRTLGATLDTSRLVGERHRILYGGSLRAIDFEINVTPGEDRRYQGAVFLEDQWSISDEALLTLGGRVDAITEQGTTLSPRIGLVLRPNRRHSWRISASRAFRSPSIIQNYIDGPMGFCSLIPGLGPFCWQTDIDGNRDLDLERLTAYEIGWTGAFPNGVMASISIYRNETRDFIDLYTPAFYDDEDPPPGWPAGAGVPPGVFSKIFTYRNVGRTIDYGVETSIDTQHTDRWSTRFQWSWQNPTHYSGFEGEDLFNIAPLHRAGIQVRYHGQRTAVSFGGNYQDDAFWADIIGSQYAGPTDSWFAVNAAVSVTSPGERYRWKVRGTNLFDDEVQQHVWGDIIGRRIVGELSVRF